MTMRPDTAPDPPADVAGEAGQLDAQRVLQAIDDGLNEHAGWMSRWHRALVCRLPPDADLLAEDQHLTTAFGRWYSQHAEDPLLQQPAVRELWQTFVDVHSLAKLLAERVSDDRPVPVGEYDELVRRQESFRQQARRLRDAFRKAISELDPLTGLSTRSVMMAELEQEFERVVSAPDKGQGLAIALADIDHFKRINDNRGHAVGDEVLVAVAGRFLSRLRPTDSIYRYGGEEFLIGLPNANAGTAASVLERLRAALAERPIGLEDGGKLEVTASFGVAQADPSLSLKQVIERADRALYAAKRGGRDRVCGWRKELETLGSDSPGDAQGQNKRNQDKQDKDKGKDDGG